MQQPPWQSLGLRWLGPGLALGMVVLLGWATAVLPALTLWDQALLLGLHRYGSPTLDRAILWFTDLGTVWGVLPGTVILGGILIWQRQWRRAFFLILAVAGSLLINLFLKNIWHRARPSLWEGVPVYPDHSFPSGHATLAMAFLLAVMLISRTSPYRHWIALLACSLALLVGLSRLYLGVHYPSDVMGGWLLGIGWTLGIHRAMFPPPAQG